MSTLTNDSPTTTSTGDFIEGASAVLVGGGLVTMALFSLAIPSSS
jgi:hypothetical protein